MLVCHCRAVSDRHIHAAALGGARRVRDVVSTCGAGGVCGGCRPVIEEILESVVALPRSRAAVA